MRFPSASVIARRRGRVVQMLCAPGFFRAVSRAPYAQHSRHMLQFLVLWSMPPRGVGDGWYQLSCRV